MMRTMTPMMTQSEAPACPPAPPSLPMTAAEALAAAMAHAACEKLNPPGGERAGGAALRLRTGEDADDLEVTLLPEGEGGCARIGEGLLEAATGRGLMSASLPPLLPRIWSMPKLSLPVVTVAGEDMMVNEVFEMIFF